jgi:hypothetical protein
MRKQYQRLNSAIRRADVLGSRHDHRTVSALTPRPEPLLEPEPELVDVAASMNKNDWPKLLDLVVALREAAINDSDTEDQMLGKLPNKAGKLPNGQLAIRAGRRMYIASREEVLSGRIYFNIMA